MKFLNTLETIVKVVVALMVIALILSLLFENKTKPTEGQKNAYDEGTKLFYQGLIQYRGYICSEVESYVPTGSGVYVTCVGAGESDKPSSEVTEAHSYNISRPGGTGAFIIEAKN